MLPARVFAQRLGPPRRALGAGGWRAAPSAAPASKGHGDVGAGGGPLLTLWRKVQGQPGATAPPRASGRQIAVSGAMSFLGIGAVSGIHFGLCDASDATLVLGSFGATAVLVYGAPSLPFSQPRNVIGGHVLSAFVGVACQQALAVPMGSPWLAAPIAVSAATMLMQATRTVHPPAGGTALISVLGSEKLYELGFGLLAPTASGASVLVAVALLNNLDKDRSYPTHWW